MQSYLVELYVPRLRVDDVRRSARRARAAADALADEGTPIRYVRTTFLPDDETCFHLFEADSVATVDGACTRARLGHVRIVRAVERDS